MITDNFLEKANDLFSYTQNLRRDFHQHPELGFEEFRTAKIVSQELTELGLEVTTGVGKTGVVAILEGNYPGPVILMRFDMDALPVTEETGASYASLTPGLMHACGHDGHTALGLTTARILAAHREEIHGKIKFAFQPAEEGRGGAEAMIKDGVLQNPKVDAALGLHLWNQLPVGNAAVTPGAFMAGSDEFTITITGKGGHGASPEASIDPIVAAAQVVLALQTIVARNVPPQAAVVISVTQVQAGTAFNIIPPESLLKGTIRYFDKEVHQRVTQRMEEIVTHVAAGFECSSTIEIIPMTPVVFNDSDIAQIVTSTGNQVIENINIKSEYKSTVSEDMSLFLEQVPGCFFFVGSANPEKGLDFGHHHPKFDFDESVLPVAAAWIAAAAVNLGNKK